MDLLFLCLQGKHVNEALSWTSMFCDDTEESDGITLFFLLLISAEIQANHIQKAKRGSVIHKTTKKRPGGV